MKYSLKIYAYLLLFVTLLTSCNENLTLIQEVEKNNYKTASISEVENFLISLGENSPTEKSDGIELSYDVNLLDYESINNSNELLAVVPASTKYENIYSRILLLNVNGTLESVLFNMLSDESIESDHFYGKIAITDLDGKLRGLLRVEDGFIVSHYILGKSQQKNNCVVDDLGDIDCGSLEEVIVVADLRLDRGGFEFSTDFWEGII